MKSSASAADLDAFERLAAEFARTLGPGDVVALSGELGAGKTTFVRAVVRELHGNDGASSPTFVFWNRYAGTPPIEHLDCYRVESPEDARELGLEESLDSESIVLIEWPERLPALIPDDAVRVAIEGAGDEPRRLTFERP